MENKSYYKIVIRVGVGCFLFFVFAFTYNFYNTFYLKNTKFSDEKVYIYIPTGTDFDNLKKQISPFLLDTTTFFNAAKKKEYSTNIKAGKFEIKKDFSNNHIINSLRSKNIPVKVTFNNIERLEILASKISKIIEADSISLMKAFLDDSFLSSNGFDTNNVLTMFLPNTYEFYWNTSPEKFRNRMLKEYKRFWNTDRLEKSTKIGFTTVEVSILASIVEKETFIESDKKKVAGVFINRLNKSMKLESCPTVIYSMKRNTNKYDMVVKRLLFSDLKIDSPYNTYMYKNLPPGPIYMPELSSIEAVLNYENHNFLFFVVDVNDNTKNSFSKTYAEHLIKSKKYQSMLDSKKIFR
jgi:UPF0755 protein